MPSSTRVLVLFGLGLATAARPAWAQDAGDRCSGTLCDLYYGSRPATPAPGTPRPAAPDGATPLALPNFRSLFSSGSDPAPAAPVASAAAPAPAGPLSRVQVQGGGLVGKLTGAPDQRCTGTFCDLYYGGAPPEPRTPTEAAVTPAEGAEARSAPEASPYPPDEPRESASVRFAKPTCVAPAGDPWKCYR